LRSKFLQAGLGFRFKTDFHKRSLYQRGTAPRKTCDIADPYQIITWVPPEGGGGPNYDGM
jgi:hypothetical protein